MADQTPYVETEALLAVMNEEDDLAQEIVSGMLHGELITFARQLHGLVLMVENAAKDKGARRAWHCSRCGSARWVGYRAGPEHEGFPQRAQCVHCGYVQGAPDA